MKWDDAEEQQAAREAAAARERQRVTAVEEQKNGGDMEVRDLQHCSKCGETCNPGTGMTVKGDRFHKDACPVVNHAARAAAGQRLKEAREGFR